jgi:hypothetical protein
MPEYTSSMAVSTDVPWSELQSLKLEMSKQTDFHAFSQLILQNFVKLDGIVWKEHVTFCPTK